MNAIFIDQKKKKTNKTQIWNDVSLFRLHLIGSVPKEDTFFFKAITEQFSSKN